MRLVVVLESDQWSGLRVLADMFETTPADLAAQMIAYCVLERSDEIEQHSARQTFTGRSPRHPYPEVLARE